MGVVIIGARCNGYVEKPGFPAKPGFLVGKWRCLYGDTTLWLVGGSVGFAGGLPGKYSHREWNPARGRDPTRRPYPCPDIG